MKTFGIICVLFGAAFAGASAQTPTPTPSALPPGPLMERYAPKFSAWTVTTGGRSSSAHQDDQEEQPDGKGADQGRTSHVDQVMQIVKTGDIRYIRITVGNSRTERWCKGAVQIIKRPEWPEPLLSTGENLADAARLDLGSGDFEGFEWISAQNFVGVRNVGGRDCLVFQQKIAAEKRNKATERVFFGPDGKVLSGESKEPEKVLAVACTDLESRLPVALTVGKQTTMYKFGDPPTEMLTLPAEFQASLEKYTAKMAALMRKPARP